MSAQTLLSSLFQYKAWADEGLMAGLAELGKEPSHAGYAGYVGYDSALRILRHVHIVDRIFVANLQRIGHGYATTEADEAPKEEELFNAIRETDHWYIGYVACLGDAELSEVIDFTFTDGTPGRMSREEMLAHVITYSGYHRGEAGRIMTQLTGSSPRDTFTGYLHEAEPGRREWMR